MAVKTVIEDMYMGHKVKHNIEKVLNKYKEMDAIPAHYLTKTKKFINRGKVVEDVFNLIKTILVNDEDFTAIVTSIEMACYEATERELTEQINRRLSDDIRVLHEAMQELKKSGHSNKAIEEYVKAFNADMQLRAQEDCDDYDYE